MTHSHKQKGSLLPHNMPNKHCTGLSQQNPEAGSEPEVGNYKFEVCIYTKLVAANQIYLQCDRCMKVGIA